MSELVKKIEIRLKDLYPQFSVRISTAHNHRAIIYINDKKLNEFNPTLLESELEFLKDKPNYIDFVIQAIREPIDKYTSKILRGTNTGPNSRGLSIQQIKDAIAHTKSCRAASIYLKVSYPTFKKYAVMYKDEDGVNLFQKHKNQSGGRIPKGTYASMGRWSLQDIFDGKADDKYPKWRLKKRLVENAIIADKCAICEFEERRITDYKVPLELDFIDGDELNRKLENLRLLCYNCYFLNTGDFFWRRIKRKKFKELKVKEKETEARREELNKKLKRRRGENEKDEGVIVFKSNL